MENAFKKIDRKNEIIPYLIGNMYVQIFQIISTNNSDINQQKEILKKAKFYYKRSLKINPLNEKAKEELQIVNREFYRLWRIKIKKF